MACLRYRSRTGAPPSPEHIGDEMQISGATIRRWEAGLTEPDEEELRNFAVVCDLSRFEVEFLVRAFNARQWEQAPDEAGFRAFALNAAVVEVPALIVDSLFYARAWNRHFLLLAPGLEGSDAPHLLQLLDSSAKPDQGWSEQQHRWLREVWWGTSNFCGSPAYRRMVASLCAIEGFEREWMSFALDRSRSNDVPIGLPFVQRVAAGSFRTFVSTTTLPPRYRLILFSPLDAAARSSLDANRNGGGNTVEFSRFAHWSMASPDFKRD